MLQNMLLTHDNTAKRKHSQGLCIAYGCRTKTDGRMLCSTHRSTKMKEQNPLKYYYGVLKHNARRRGKEFSLTLDEFREFCERTEYLKKKGRNRDSITIDRIDHTRGYSADNIQAVTNSYNIRKRFIDENLARQYGSLPAPPIEGVEYRIITVPDDEEPPF